MRRRVRLANQIPTTTTRAPARLCDSAHAAAPEFDVSPQPGMIRAISGRPVLSESTWCLIDPSATMTSGSAIGGPPASNEVRGIGRRRHHAPSAPKMGRMTSPSESARLPVNSSRKSPIKPCPPKVFEERTE